MIPRHELLYSVPTYVLALALLLMSLAMIVFGRRVGARGASEVSRAETSQVSALRGSLLGLLALLVGFSFSLALGRYNDRSLAVVTEANAIGTAWLRSDLLAGAEREALRAALAD
jgi:NAD/NADP transhydrogenase beta subunit